MRHKFGSRGEEKKDCLKKREGPRELIMWGLDGGKEKRNILH